MCKEEKYYTKNYLYKVEDSHAQWYKAILEVGNSRIDKPTIIGFNLTNT